MKYLVRNVDCWQEHRPQDILLAVLLLLGIVLSYLPQQNKIIQDRSSKGISHWFLLLGSISSFSTLMNAIILQAPLLDCCRIVSKGQCVSNLLAVIQLFVQWSMNFIIFGLFYAYYPEDEMQLPPHGGSDVTFREESVEAPGWTWSKRVRKITLGYMACIVTVTLILHQTFGFPSSVSKSFSSGLGLISVVLSVFQFLPQIFKTYRLQEIGALSITAMLMQTPGSFLMCYTIANSPETTVYTWMTYFVGGLLQGCLLLLCLHLKYSSRRGRGRFLPVSSNVDD